MRLKYKKVNNILTLRNIRCLCFLKMRFDNKKNSLISEIVLLACQNLNGNCTYKSCKNPVNWAIFFNIR